MIVICRNVECDGEIDSDHDYDWDIRRFVCPDCRWDYEDWEMGDMIASAQEARAEEWAIGQAEHLQDLRDEGWEL